MIAKLVDDYVKHLAKKEGISPDDLKNKLVTNSSMGPL